MKQKTRKIIRDQKVELRLTKKEKDKLIRKAEKYEMSISDYIRTVTIENDEKKKNLVNIESIQMMVAVTDIVRYIEDHYDLEEDHALREKVVALWKK